MNNKKIYLVRLLSDTISRSNYYFIVFGVNNKLAAITYALRNRGGSINGDYSIRAEEIYIINSGHNDSIQMIELKHVSKVIG